MTSSVDTTLSDFKINSVASEKVLKQMEQAGLLEPNQIYMTPDEDVNLSQMRFEVVYNKDSSDSNINWGYTSGIKGSTSAITKDLSKFKMLSVYYQCYFANSANTGGNANCLMLDLERINENYSIASNEVAYFTNDSPNSTARFSFQAKYNHSSKALNFLFGYQANAELNNGQYFVYKIEGILKEPAMIYTGDELHAGNGITIENGVISSVQTVETLLNVSNPSSNTTKTISNISPYKTLVLLAHQTGNAYFGMTIPVPVFKMLTGGSERLVLSTDAKYFVVYYVNDTTIGLVDVASGLDKFVVYGVK